MGVNASRGSTRVHETQTKKAYEEDHLQHPLCGGFLAVNHEFYSDDPASYFCQLAGGEAKRRKSIAEQTEVDERANGSRR
ncbi:hypothetical protein ACLOJK_022911 [Asimina triloba]